MGLGIGLAWMYAIGHLLSRHGLWPRLVLAVLFIAIGLIQLAWLLVLNGQVEHARWLLYWHQPALFLIGPCLYVYSEMISHNYERPPAYLAVHGIPFGAVLIISAIQYAMDDPAEPARLSSAMVSCSAGLGSLYIAPVINRLWRVRRQDWYLKVELVLLIALASIGALVALAALFGGLLDKALFYQVYLSLITGLMLVSYWLGVKYPELLHYVAEASEEASDQERYAQSVLHRLPVEALTAQLHQLMDQQQLYLDESLTLPRLAQALDITPHQLSELLNHRMGISFSRYLKEKRVEAAKRKLKERPEQPILEIGLEVGFSSSSAFYAAFRELEGVPPGQYRKQLSAGRDGSQIPE